MKFSFQLRNPRCTYIALMLLASFLVYFFTVHYNNVDVKRISTSLLNSIKSNGRYVYDMIETKSTYHSMTTESTIAQTKDMTTSPPVSTTHSKVLDNYVAMKPKRCVLRGMRPHCLKKGRKTGVNQSHNILTACYPQEIHLAFYNPPVDSNFPPPGEMLPIEKELLSDPEFVDIKSTVSLSNSKLTLLNAKIQYGVGDVIKVRIDLLDGYKKKRNVGHDEVRIWVKSPDGRSRSSGHITDFKNGTYLGEVKLLWQGKIKIDVAVPFTREFRSSVFKWQRRYKNVATYYGTFTKGNLNEFTYCSMYPEIEGYEKNCNFTKLNQDYSWFCGKPLNPQLGCKDITGFHDFDYVQIPLTPAQLKIFDRSSNLFKIPNSIDLNVTIGRKTQKKVPCNQLPRRETWDSRMPSGYFKELKWIPLKCENDVSKANIKNRLKDTTLLIAGDSTTRQWYTLMTKVLNSTQLTETWTKEKWYDISISVVREINFNITWYPHTLPFSISKVLDGQFSLKSARQVLDSIPSEGKVIFAMHHFAHYTRQHYTLFRDRIRSLKPSIRKALQRNPNLKIAIKSPYVYNHAACSSHMSDMPGPLFIEILKTELKEFRDSIWYLDYWDQTLAAENNVLHPDDWMVWENLRTLFGYTLGNV